MQLDNRPLFITFEGGEGTGKSTQSRKLYEYLLARGVKTIYTREVGGTPEAEKIRDILVFSELYPMSQLMLVMAARYEHLNKVVIPALNQGYYVVCDRFVDSTACYQSVDSDISAQMVYDLHNQLMPKYPGNNLPTAIMPDITFFMDMPPSEAVTRALNRGDANKFDEKSSTFHQKIYEKFRALADKYPVRIKSINCLDKDIEAIHQEIVGVILG